MIYLVSICSMNVFLLLISFELRRRAFHDVGVGMLRVGARDVEARGPPMVADAPCAASRKSFPNLLFHFKSPSNRL